MNLFKPSTFWFPRLSVVALGTVLGCLDQVPTEQEPQSRPEQQPLSHLPPNAVTEVEEVVLSADTLKLTSVGAEGTLTARAYNTAGTELTGVSIKWWQSESSPFTRDVTVCPSPCTARFQGTGVDTAKVVAYHYGGTVRDTAWVVIPSDSAPPPPSGDAVTLLAAGDIAHCSSTGDEATAKLIDALPSATVASLGDHVYPDGTAAEYANCYDPTWGRHKDRTRPAPGNHDYHTSGASAYYAYFGTNGGPAGRGYYSYDLGAWHLISLNSNVSMAAGSAQEQWLRADLAANPRQCTLAYWHHPRFNSGAVHGNFTAAQPLWQALYDAGAEIVLSGHEHTYERFGPQSATGAADPAGGVREFVVGTGGVSHYSLGTRQPNSEIFDATTWGVLKLTLEASSYTWEFIPIQGQSFTDSGTGQCH